MSKFEEIFSQYEQNNIFNVKVLQRYSRGVLVQYTEDFSSFNDNSLSFKNVHDLDNLGWVPINELCGEYKNYNELISRNLVGKTIPVLYDHYDSNNNIPILSNSHAVRKLMLLYLNPGDVVKGRVIRSDKNLALVRIGDIIAFLPVSDMSEDTYQQHLNGYSYDIPAVVTAVDVNKEYVQLSTKTLSKVTVEQLSNVNSYIKKYRKYKDNIETYNMSEHSRGHLESKRERALDYSGIEIMGLSQHKGPSSLRSATTIARTYHEENKHKKWNLLDDNFLEDDVLHAFDTKRWQLYKQDNWVDLPEIEQMVFNRGYNNNDEVCYYKSKGYEFYTLNTFI
ncbi:S1 RNA binding domain-containing protein [Theileria equi strain WA]|uniref:S1 RNA binding domain-containing protein n=1 Tax=Theileria equi strain WA TaxID=1537102 RepID=L0B1D4_THEEQ|nr:S1 RNA binding domain-containing protein [Theileria equi strain WA]AFZ81318.1 S1 RNA binding domain-containing protein [Theileria equi strain WA]|eukprot:XP_004830984.1 S1 RNA binding domain-containing protein [Theileria equi strain WA]